MQTRYDTNGVKSARILRPSDFHAHARRGELMYAVVGQIFRHVMYALVMPNNGPIRTIADALAYHEELKRLIRFELGRNVGLIMTLYHTAEITSAVVEQLAESSVVRAIKHYPPVKNLTTGSGSGVPLEESGEMLTAMERNGVPLLLHCEDAVDERGRKLDPQKGEAHMIEHRLWRLRDRHPMLRICIEHASTLEAVRFVKTDPSGRTVMTVTPHHSLFTVTDLLRYGVHLKCKPVVQTPDNRAAVREFTLSGDHRVIAGSDTAPHPCGTKEVAFDSAANGCWLPHAIELYAKVFDEAGALDQRFERFMSVNGPTWWGLPLPGEDNCITIVRDTEAVPPKPVPIPELGDVVVPLGWSEDAAQRLKIGWAIQ